MSRRYDEALQEAFDEVCTAAEHRDDIYVSIYERVSYYGGPEEGGWWGNDNVLRAWQSFPSRSVAEKHLERVIELAQKKTHEAVREWSEQCRRECDWCEDRGIDPADHPMGETDGPSDFFVVIEEDLGSSEHRGCRHYE